MSIETEEEISGIKVIRTEFSKSGNAYYKIKNEKKGSKPLNFDPRKIRNSSLRHIVQCIRFVRQELNGTKISQCSFQLICALTAKYLGTQKKDCIVNSRYRITKKYSQKVYDLAHSVYFLGMELKF